MVKLYRSSDVKIQTNGAQEHGKRVTTTHAIKARGAIAVRGGLGGVVVLDLADGNRVFERLLV